MMELCEPKRPMRRPHARSGVALSGVAALSLLSGLPVPAQLPAGLSAPSLLLAPVAAAGREAAPTPELFRRLQLLTLACGRENSAESCRQARAMADPLLDQPRLSARCKDVLWSIRELAQTAPSNSLARRDGIDRAAKDVTVICAPAPRPAAPAGPASPGPSGGASRP